MSNWFEKNVEKGLYGIGKMLGRVLNSNENMEKGMREMLDEMKKSPEKLELIFTPKDFDVLKPEKGVDYWTEEDIQELLARVGTVKGDTGSAGKDGTDGKAGKDADETKIFRALLKRIPKPAKVNYDKVFAEINRVLSASLQSEADRKKEIKAIVSDTLKNTPTKRLILKTMKEVETKAKALSVSDFEAIARGLEKLEVKKKLDYGAGLKNKPIQFSGGGTSTTSTTAGVATPTVTAKTADYTVALSDFGNILSMNSASNKTFTLPALTSSEVGKTLTLVKLGTGKVTIQAPASTTIADSTSAGTLYNDSTTETWSNVVIQVLTTTKILIVGGDGTWFTT